MKSSASMPLLSSFAAAGNIPWNTLCTCPNTTAPWMRLTEKDVQALIAEYSNSASKSLIQ